MEIESLCFSVFSLFMSSKKILRKIFYKNENTQNNFSCFRIFTQRKFKSLLPFYELHKNVFTVYIC